jgi:hypothetical protein
MYSTDRCLITRVRERICWQQGRRRSFSLFPFNKMKGDVHSRFRWGKILPSVERREDAGSERENCLMVRTKRSAAEVPKGEAERRPLGSTQILWPAKSFRSRGRKGRRAKREKKAAKK